MMQASFNNIVQHLFHQPSLHSVTVDELEHMASEHPYFAAAHFLLLKKMQDTDHPQFTEQLHKTTIYFNNPLWLQYLLQPETVANFTVLERSPFITNEQAGQPPVPVNENSNSHTETVGQKEEETAGAPFAEIPQEDEPAAADTVDDPGPDIIPAEHGGMMDIISQVFSDPNPLYNAVAVEEINTPDAGETQEQSVDEPVSQAGDTENIASQEEPAAEETGTKEEDSPQHPMEASMTAGTPEPAAAGDEPLAVAGEVNEPEPVPETFPENDHTIETASAQQENNADPSMTGTNQEETPVDTIFAEQTSNSNSENAAEQDSIEPVAAAGTTAVEGNPIEQVAAEIHTQEQDADNTEETVTQKANHEELFLIKTIIETPAAKNDLLFEPYHTVDYFASQGIKLSRAEADSKDKLGRQLKSFTDWLKTMKKLPQVSIDKILAENEESKVVEDANHSLESKEVLTEAMAEVYEKQGMNDKAAAIYRKLSLLNSAKSAYFAGRIEALKQ